METCHFKFGVSSTFPPQILNPIDPKLWTLQQVPAQHDKFVQLRMTLDSDMRPVVYDSLGFRVWGLGFRV